MGLVTTTGRDHTQPSTAIKLHPKCIGICASQRTLRLQQMPLAPMGCAAQIHEKSDKRGTWQYHTVDGWYLNTSPIHYRTHVCHIKETKKERLTDTVQFQHKRITNPTISHADKIMHAIQQVIREIKKLGGIENSLEARDLQTLVNGANDYLQSTELLDTRPVPR